MNKYFFFLLFLFLMPTVIVAQEKTDKKESDIVIFQTLDEDDIERLSKIYGHQIFKSDSSRIFDASSIAKIPDSYTLGEGDELTISIFGASQYDAKFTVGPEGYIQPQKMPRIFLKGLQWGTVKDLVQSRFKKFYLFRPEQFALTLSQPRIITVNILGEVERPGSYNLVATNTAFNALIAAGGPSETGSFRNIRIIRDQEQVELDIYEVMDKPGAQFQFYLEDNIIIQVPVAQKIIELKGAVKRPLKYELKGEEGLLEAIKYAGGLSAAAYQEVVHVQRFIDNKQILIDVDLANLYSTNGNFALQNGDVIQVKSLTQPIENYVRVEGAVELVGNYALESTARVSDLLRKSILKKEAKLDLAFLVRENEDKTSKLVQLDLNEIINGIGTPADLRLKSKDRLIIYTQSRYVEGANIFVKGAVRDSLSFPFDPDSTITIRKAILLAGGLKLDAADFGYLIRTNRSNIKEKSYRRINIKEALENPNSTANVKLQPADELRISPRSAYSDISMVSIKGAVRAPEAFQYDKSLRLKDLIFLAEGFKPEASKKLDVFRLKLENDQPTKIVVATLEVDNQFNIVSGDKDFELMPNDEVVARTVPDFNEQALVTVNGEVIFPGAYSLIKKNETLASIIQRAGGLTTEAFPQGVVIHRDAQKIVTNLDEALKNNQSNYNVILKGGDIITLPQKEDLVSILIRNTGAMDLSKDTLAFDNVISVAFEKGKSAKWYLQEYAAGFGKTADKEKVIVQYANGATKGTKRWLMFNKYPKPEKGAIISVGAMPEPLEATAKDAANEVYPKLKKGVILSIDSDLMKNLKENEENEEKTAAKGKKNN